MSKKRRIKKGTTMKRPKYINRPFTRLPLKHRACYILYLAGFTTRQIGTLLATDFSWISRIIKHGIEEYGKNDSNKKVYKVRG